MVNQKKMFGDEFFLPQSLLDDILKGSEKIRSEIESIHKQLNRSREYIRNELIEFGFLKTFDGSSLRPANTCAIDGSYVIEKLLSVDVICAAAVGVEGQPPESRGPLVWKEPHHDSCLLCTPHSEVSGIVARSLMAMKEINLASNAPHDVVLLDGSGFTPLAAAASGMKYIDSLSDPEIFKITVDEYSSFKKNYRKLLSGEDDNHIYAFLAKYVTSKYFSKKFLKELDIDDRTLATLVLRENEYIYVHPQRPTGGHQIVLPNGETDKYQDVLSSLITIYYRPRHELPAIKIEVARSVFEDSARFSFLLESISAQCFSPGILEPYPLFLADQLAKNIKEAVRASRESATLQNQVSNLLNDVQVFMNFYSFRTSQGGE